MKALDLIGQRFGKLVVISRAGNDSFGRAHWNCVCDCGQECVYCTGDLNSWRNSCGCISILTGKSFGLLTVLGKAEKQIKGKTLWKCICQCGGLRTTSTNKLKSGHVKSCGCLGRPSYILKGQKFGRLTAERIVKNSTWECVCDCGNSTTATQKDLRAGTKKSCGCMRKSKEYLTGMKTCTKCGEKKEVSQFHHDKGAPGGIYSQCADCKNKRSKIYRNAHPFYHRTIDPEKKREASRRWRENNPEKTRATYTRRHARELATLRGRLNNRMSAAVWKALRDNKQGRPWESLVGYTVDQLKRHIGKRFTDGMSWDALMRGEIHIDHKIPKAVFNYDKPTDIDFKKCWALKNLRPMWADANRSKNAKIEKPFQPSLTMEVQ